jgi:hypothetical protein
LFEGRGNGKADFMEGEAGPFEGVGKGSSGASDGRSGVPDGAGTPEGVEKGEPIPLDGVSTGASFGSSSDKGGRLDAGPSCRFTGAAVGARS